MKAQPTRQGGRWGRAVVRKVPAFSLALSFSHRGIRCESRRETWSHCYARSRASLCTTFSWRCEATLERPCFLVLVHDWHCILGCAVNRTTSPCVPRLCGCCPTLWPKQSGAKMRTLPSVSTLAISYRFSLSSLPAWCSYNTDWISIKFSYGMNGMLVRNNADLNHFADV